MTKSWSDYANSSAVSLASIVDEVLETPVLEALSQKLHLSH